MQIIFTKHAQKRPLSTGRITRKTHTPWPTAKKYLNSMKRHGELSAYRSNNKIFWKPQKKKNDW
jgi:DNA-binding IclR family transcriptional regulator